MADKLDLAPERRKDLSRRQDQSTNQKRDATTLGREAQAGKDAKSPSRPAKRQGTLAFRSGSLKVASKEEHTAQSLRESLKKVCYETKNLLPGLLATRPDAPPDGVLYKDNDLVGLDSSRCPRLPPTSVSVINSDSIDAAISLAKTRPRRSGPVCVLNMANAHSAGGGWTSGSLAQEEAMCYRSSLSFTLKLRHYPLPKRGGIFSPTVLVIRHGLDKGHHLADLPNPHKLHVISVVSVAAVSNPPITQGASGIDGYKKAADRELMLDKMRSILRIAAINGKRRLILGAFGCGAFANPNHQVAQMWKDVLGEKEFKGWFEDVVFAVLGSSGKNDNFTVFKNELNGCVV